LRQLAPVVIQMMHTFAGDPLFLQGVALAGVSDAANSRIIIAVPNASF